MTDNVEEMMIPSDDHPCIIESRKDPELRPGFQMVHCACHDGNSWRIWRIGDEVIKCRGTDEDLHQ